MDREPRVEPPEQAESARSREQREVDGAAQEAAQVGGEADRRTPPSMRPVIEAGGGEAEGFELAEELLVEHASHGDEQAAHAVLHHEGPPEALAPGYADGESDQESKEVEDTEADAREHRDERN
jgi:hypothetical protein